MKKIKLILTLFLFFLFWVFPTFSAWEKLNKNDILINSTIYNINWFTNNQCILDNKNNSCYLPYPNAYTYLNESWTLKELTPYMENTTPSSNFNVPWAIFGYTAWQTTYYNEIFIAYNSNLIRPNYIPYNAGGQTWTLKIWYCGNWNIKIPKWTLTVGQNFLYNFYTKKWEINWNCDSWLIYLFPEQAQISSLLWKYDDKHISIIYELENKINFASIYSNWKDHNINILDFPIPYSDIYTYKFINPSNGKLYLSIVQNDWTTWTYELKGNSFSYVNNIFYFSHLWNNKYLVLDNPLENIKAIKTDSRKNLSAWYFINPLTSEYNFYYINISWELYSSFVLSEIWWEWETPWWSGENFINCRKETLIRDFIQVTPNNTMEDLECVENWKYYTCSGIIPISQWSNNWDITFSYNYIKSPENFTQAWLLANLVWEQNDSNMPFKFKDSKGFASWSASPQFKVETSWNLELQWIQLLTFWDYTQLSSDIYPYGMVYNVQYSNYDNTWYSRSYNWWKNQYDLWNTIVWAEYFENLVNNKKVVIGFEWFINVSSDSKIINLEWQFPYVSSFNLKYKNQDSTVEVEICEQWWYIYIDRWNSWITVDEYKNWTDEQKKEYLEVANEKKENGFWWNTEIWWIDDTSTTSAKCQAYFNQWNAWNLTNIDLSLSIIPCGFSYITTKIKNTFKWFFNFWISLDKEKKEWDFWQWVRDNSSAFIPSANADFIGFEWEWNAQINNIMENFWQSKKIKVWDNTLWLFTIIAKIILNLSAFVLMLVCFTTKNSDSIDSITSISWKMFLIIFFIIIIFSIEIIANFTSLNPLWLLEILNFFDLWYRTAVWMALIWIFGYTVRNFA